MKKFYLLSIALMLGIMLSAQTQQGYVKTKGRMVNGQHVPGQGLKGATVSIKGRTAVSVLLPHPRGAVPRGLGAKKRLPIGRHGRAFQDLQTLRQPDLSRDGDA